MGVTGSSQTIALDSNIFIRSLDDSTSLGEKARKFLEQLKDSSRIFISAMVLEEFFVRVYKEKREKEIPILLEFITLGGLCTIINIDQAIALAAARLRAEIPSLRAPDALHIASAIESGAKIFYTTDKRLPRKINKLAIKLI